MKSCQSERGNGVAGGDWGTACGMATVASRDSVTVYVGLGANDNEADTD